MKTDETQVLFVWLFCRTGLWGVRCFRSKVQFPPTVTSSFPKAATSLWAWPVDTSTFCSDPRLENTSWSTWTSPCRYRSYPWCFSPGLVVDLTRVLVPVCCRRARWFGSPFPTCSRSSSPRLRGSSFPSFVELRRIRFMKKPQAQRGKVKFMVTP